MAAKFLKSQKIPRGESVYYYNYRKSPEGFHVSSMCCCSGGSEDDTVRIRKSFAAPFKDMESMHQEMIRHVDSHYSASHGHSGWFDGTITFGEFFTRQKATIANERNWKDGPDSTRYKNIQSIDNQIIPKIGDRPIGELTAADCISAVKQCEQEYIDRGNAGYQSARAEHLLALMSTVFEYAKAYRVISANPLGALPKNNRGQALMRRVKTLRLKPKSIPIPKLREILGIIEGAVDEKSEYLVFALMAGLGLRNNAAEGLRFCDILEAPDRSMRSARVVMQSTKERRVVVGAKNEYSYRKIPVLPEIWRIIEKRFDYIKRAYSDIPESELELLTIACKGNDIYLPCNNDDTDRAVEKLFEKAGVNHSILVPVSPRMKEAGVAEDNATSYLFRRNFASMLFDLAGLDETEAMYLMGHSRKKVSASPNIKYDSWERQYKLYRKMLRISAFLNGEMQPDTLCFDENAPDAYVEDCTAVRICVHLKKGETLKLQVSANEPYDAVSVSNAGPEKIEADADIYTVKNRYGARAANLMGCIDNIVLPDLTGFVWEPETAHAEPENDVDETVDADVSEGGPAVPPAGQPLPQAGSAHEAPQYTFEDESDEDDPEFWNWLKELLGEKEFESMFGDGEDIEDREYWWGMRQGSASYEGPLAPIEDLEIKDFPSWALVRRTHVPEYTTLVIVTSKGYVFQLKEALIPRQNPNTRGMRVMDTALMGTPETMLLADVNKSTHITAITDAGARYKIRLNDIPCAGTAEMIGELLRNRKMDFLWRFFTGDEKITHIMSFPEDPPIETKLALATNMGGVAKVEHGMAFSAYTRKNVIKLTDGERVTGGIWCTDEDAVMLVSSDSHVLPLKVKELPDRTSVSMAVNGISLKGGAECIGIAPGNGLLATISQSGKGKRTEARYYHPFDDPTKTIARGSLGKQANALASGESLTVALPVAEGGYLYLASSDGCMLKLAIGDIPVTGRIAAGNRLMRPSNAGWVCCGAFGPLPGER